MFIEDIVYKSLEGSRSVSKSKGYYLIFIGSILSLEYYKIFGILNKPNSVKALPNIKLYKEFYSTSSL